MASSYFFDGREYTTPSTMSKVIDDAMVPVATGGTNILAILGEAKGGQPGYAYAFGNPTDAAAALISGELLDMVQKAWNVSDEVTSPATVRAIRVGTAVQASLSLLDSASAATLKLLSSIYGSAGNQTRVKIETGTTKGKKVTVQLGNDYVSQDNLAYDVMTVRYSGTATGATMNMVLSGARVIVSGLPEVFIDLTTISTVGDLVDKLNSISGVTATVSSTYKDLPIYGLMDSFTGLDIKTATQTLLATNTAIKDWLNGTAVSWLTCTFIGVNNLPVANLDWTYLAGGSEIAPTLTDWSTAFDTLKGVDCSAFAVLSSNASVHAMADAHAVFMSGAGKKERRGFVGPALATSLDAVQLLPKALNSDRTALCWPGVIFTGEAKVRPPYMLAGLVAAGFCGLTPGEAMTNKTLKIAGLEYSPKNPTDTDLLIKAGVLCAEETEDGYKVVRSISTHLSSDKYNRVEISCGFAVDYVSRALRKAVDPERGRGAGPLSASRALQRAQTALEACADAGIIIGDENTPAYRNLTATITGDVTSIAVECSPVVPNNFLPITISAVPYSGTVTV